MQKRILNIFTACVLTILGSLSCQREELAPSTGGADALKEGECWLYMNFGSKPESTVSTKFTLGQEENNIYNIFVFVFGPNGHKLYANWLRSSDLLADEAAVRASSKDSWWVNNSTADNVMAKGGFKIKSSAGENLSAYLIANLDADMVKISSDLLSHSINTEDDLKNFILYMNVESVNRNGLFPMTAHASGITMSESNGNSIVDMNTSSTPVLFERVDAKVKFVFKVGDRYDPNKQTASSFTPKQWKVVNVPNTAYVFERDEDSYEVPSELPTSDYSLYASRFFDTPWRNFEEVSSTSSGFSFYMLENRQNPKNKSFTSYNDRSRQIKTSAGLNEKLVVDYVNSLGKNVSKQFLRFQNANDFSTYVLVTGRVDMELKDDAAGQVLGGDVQYLIHLGNWNYTAGDAWNSDVYEGATNYNTERNTFYTYTVTINSVNNIRVEVETSDQSGGSVENQPGASGEVVIAKESISICDSHYESRTLSFRANNFITKNQDGSFTTNADDLTWKVKTPFNPDGAMPVRINGIDVADHIDYKWVHFRLNKQDEDGNYYSEKRRTYVPMVFALSETMRNNVDPDGTQGLKGYHNDGVMDISYLVDFVRTQSQLYADYLNDKYYLKKADPVNKSLFDRGESGGSGEANDLKAKISVTAFVDEFYYDEHPISHTKSATLWKKFVNQPDRAMHILCNSKVSTDQESSATGSVISILQKSIKTIYNVDENYTSLVSAWGLESDDEANDVVHYYNQNSSNYSDSGKNTDLYNGRANTVFEWGLAPSGVTVTTIDDVTSGAKWQKYMDYEVDNQTPQMRDGYKSLRYYCMARNRDNNGDGIISRDEVRWYMASSMQLFGIVAGHGLLEQSSRLYNRTLEDKTSGVPARWYQLVVSSTHHSNTGVVTIYAQEGFSSASYSQARGWEDKYGVTQYATRCVRNLGLDSDAALNLMPQNYIEVEEKATSANQTYYSFECTNLDENALRDYTSRDFSYQDETAPTNLLYKKFETSPERVWPMSSDNTNRIFSGSEMNAEITSATNASSVDAGFCPEGYRVPNQLEMALMLYNAKSCLDDQNQICRTYWSLGTKGLNLRKNNNENFSVNSRHNITVSMSGKDANADNWTKSIRCVKDVRTE